MAERKCENWLKTFLKWTVPVSEAPESLLIWSGLFCISAVVKKKIQFSKEYLKQYQVYMMNYTMFVGPPGVVRKSTSAGFAQDILMGVNEGISVTDRAYVNFGPTTGSHAKIIEKMAGTVDGSMTIIAGEFGNIVSTMPEETYTFFLKMFDSDKTATRFEHSTRQHGDEVILDPSLNILGCTTPDWIAENKGYMLGGGFAARTVFLFEDRARQRHLFYKNVGPSIEALEGMRKRLVVDLKGIGRLRGEIKPCDDKLANRMEEWYLDYADKTAKAGAETFHARKHIHTMRTAMALSLCESDNLVISEEHFNAALVLIDDIEKKLTQGLSAVGRNPYAKDLNIVLAYIEENAPVKKGQVMTRFWADLQPDELEKILKVLKACGEISERREDGMLKKL